MRGSYWSRPLALVFTLGPRCAHGRTAAVSVVSADPVTLAMADYVALVQRAALNSVAGMYTADELRRVRDLLRERRGVEVDLERRNLAVLHRERFSDIANEGRRTVRRLNRVVR